MAVSFQTGLYFAHDLLFLAPLRPDIRQAFRSDAFQSVVKTVKPLLYLGGMAVFMPYIHVPVELYTVLLGVLSKQQPAHGSPLPRYAAVKGPPHVVADNPSTGESGGSRVGV